MSVPGFGENWKNESGVCRTGNGTRGSSIKNGCNDFPQIRYINTV